MGDFKRNSSAGAGFDDNNGHDLSNKPAISGKKSAILKTSGISEKAVSASLSDPVVDKYGKPKNVSSLFLIGVALVILSAGAAWIWRDEIGAPILLGLVGALAGIGVFFLFLLYFFVQIVFDIFKFSLIAHNFLQSNFLLFIFLP